MKFILVALVAGLLATPGAGQYPLVQNDVACNQLDRFMLSASNNTCSITLQSNVKNCIPSFEKTAAMTPNFYLKLETLVRACKEEKMQTETEAFLKHLQNQHKKFRCNRYNLNIRRYA